MKDIIGFVNHLKAQVTKNKNSIDAYKHVAKEFIAFLGNKETISQEDINEFLNQQWQKYKNNSMINRVGGVRHYLRYCGYDIRRKNEGMNRGFEVKIPKAQFTRNTEEHCLTEAEVQSIFNEAKHDPYENALVKVFYFTSQRISSVLALKINDVDFEKRVITFHKMKRGESRPRPHTVPVDDVVLSAIREYLKTRPQTTETALFLNRTHPTRANEDKVRRHLKEISVRAGITKDKQIYPHIFRRSSTTHRYKHGMQDTDIMAITGHEDIHSLTAYKVVDIEDIRQRTQRCTPTFQETPKAEPQTEVEEMKKMIKQLLEENQKLKEKKEQNTMYG